MPKIAILLTVFNGESWLEEQLESILAQENVILDLYISDDLSSDLSQKIIHDYANKFSNVTVLPSHTRQGNAALNFFRLIRDVDFADYSYIAFSDQDDIWLPEKLSIALDKIKRQNIDGYSSNVTAFWSHGKKQLIHKAQSQTKYDYMFESAGPGCTFVISQKLALSLQGLLRKKQTEIKTVALHDWFIYAFARSNNYKWYIDPTPTILYRQHATNVVGANTGVKAFIARLSKLKQGWYLQQILLIAKELGYQNSVPIQKITRLSILDRCYLAVFAYQCRRRLRDRLAFAFFTLFLAKKS